MLKDEGEFGLISHNSFVHKYRVTHINDGNISLLPIKRFKLLCLNEIVHYKDLFLQTFRYLHAYDASHSNNVVIQNCAIF